ncbi:hypothetical protein ACFSNO_23845 [Streptomyces cirratus]
MVHPGLVLPPAAVGLVSVARAPRVRVRGLRQLLGAGEYAGCQASAGCQEERAQPPPYELPPLPETPVCERPVCEKPVVVAP